MLALAACVEEVPLGPAPPDQTDCSFQVCGDPCGFYVNDTFVTVVDGLPLVCAGNSTCVPFSGTGCLGYDSCKEEGLACGASCSLCVNGPCEAEGEWHCAPLGYCRYGAALPCD